MVPVLIACLIVALAAVVFLVIVLRSERARGRALGETLERLRDVSSRYSGIMDLEAEEQRLNAELHALKEAAREQRARTAEELQQAQVQASSLVEGAKVELQKINTAIAHARAEAAVLDEEAEFQAHGLYTPRYNFESSDLYKARLGAIRASQKSMVKDGRAAVCDTEWTVQGSAARGRKMARDNIKMMLSAFNGVCDAAVLKVKYNNIASLEQRIMKSFESVNKLNEINRCRVTAPYLHAKLEELRLAHEYQEKRQAEKEEQRRIKEQMREEQRAAAEIEKALKEAAAEAQRYHEALAKARDQVARATGKKHARLVGKIEELERKLKEAEENNQRAVSRAQLTRSGHVYVISNIGSFGAGVYKIGMTRRLVPMDRVKELGDASVPFSFDVHAMIFAEDAPKLENELHRQFDAHRVNKVNTRKEFFRVPLEVIERAARAIHGEIEFTRIAEAEEFRKSQVGVRPQVVGAASAPPPPPPPARVATNQAAGGV